MTSVPTKTGSDLSPVDTTWATDSPNPSTTIDPCKTVLDVNAKPGRRRSAPRRDAGTMIPATMAKTGAPTTGTRPPSRVAMPAMAAAAATPGATVASRRLPGPGPQATGGSVVALKTGPASTTGSWTRVTRSPSTTQLGPGKRSLEGVLC